jgi:hypothetical protein
MEQDDTHPDEFGTEESYARLLRRMAAEEEEHAARRARLRMVDAPKAARPYHAADEENGRRRRWRRIRFRCQTVQLFLYEPTGAVAVAVLEEGERRPEDSKEGIRWVDPDRPIRYRSGTLALLPVVLDRALPNSPDQIGDGLFGRTGVWVTVSDAIWLSHWLGLAIDILTIDYEGLYRVHRLPGGGGSV